MTAENKLLTCEEAAQRLRLSKKSLEKMRQRGDGPRFAKIGRRCVRYFESDLTEYAERRRFRSTSEYDEAAS